METPENKGPAPPKEDLELARRIAGDDREAWGEFVARFSPWVFYTARQWCERHCPPHNRGTACGLYLNRLRLEGRRTNPGSGECDDGMDVYLWVFEQLLKRIKKYEGRKGSSLSTFVWRILNSREFYVDWLRSRYGRVF